MLSTGGEVGDWGIHWSRWRTDGSHYHSILRDGEREAGRLGEGEITMKKKKGESEDVVGVKEKKNWSRHSGWGQKEHRHVAVSQGWEAPLGGVIFQHSATVEIVSEWVWFLYMRHVSHCFDVCCVCLFVFIFPLRLWAYIAIVFITWPTNDKYSVYSNAHSEFDTSNTFLKSSDGPTKDWESCWMPLKYNPQVKRFNGNRW